MEYEAINKHLKEKNMTIDEAIKHAREVAEENRKQEALENQCDLFWNAQKCRRCAKEHEQLAEWLEELKFYKEKDQKFIHLTEQEFADVYNKGRADAIDEMLSKIHTTWLFRGNDAKAYREEIDYIAEQLKEQKNDR